MQPDTNPAEEIQRFRPNDSIESAFTPPASWYTSSSFPDLEKESVFRDQWLFVGRLDQLDKPGDYFSGTFLGWPYVVVLDDEKVPRAFYNICSHHGMCVALREGSTEQFVCPYHGWTYDRLGKLTEAPRAGALQSLKQRNLDLKPIQVSQWGPFVALHFGTPSTSLETELAPLLSSFAANPYENIQFVRRVTYRIDCNWKVFVDNYLDGGYHVAHVHPGLTGQLDISSYRSTLGERWSMQSCAATSTPGNDSSADFTQRIGQHADYAWIYPNFMINRYGPWMDTNTVIPLSFDSCLVIFDYYHEGPLETGFQEQSLTASDRVQQEDIEICNQVQVGLNSGVYQQGVYAPGFEEPMLHFHRLLHAVFQARVHSASDRDKSFPTDDVGE
ncbi:MAG: aromatic ring-hydroxylating dioxygenase subunit alpha [Planctomycetaceae bacterium]